MADDPGTATDGPTDPPTHATAPSPITRSSSGLLIDLAERQLALLEVFRLRSDGLAAIYLGALHTFYDAKNPDRLALTAHGIREVMMEMPKHFVVPLPEADARLGDQVDALRQAWTNVNDKRSEGDPLPPRFVKRLEKFFAWLEGHRPRFKESAALIVRSLDPSGRAMPKPIEAIRVEEWNVFRTFFVRVAHHDEGCTDSEFALWIERFEMFLLNLVRPRTFDNADRLDALIREGEGDG